MPEQSEYTKSNTLIDPSLALSKTIYTYDNLNFSKSWSNWGLNPTKIHLDGLLGSSVSFITRALFKKMDVLFFVVLNDGGSLLFE
jgi:transcription-repair coupling factor (superfamily II helicase)